MAFRHPAAINFKETRDAWTSYQGNKRCVHQIPATMLRLSGLSLPFWHIITLLHWFSGFKSASCSPDDE
jgi:hypothetical protein